MSDKTVIGFAVTLALLHESLDRVTCHKQKVNTSDASKNFCSQISQQILEFQMTWVVVVQSETYALF